MSDQSKRQYARAPVELRVEYRRMNAFFADYTRDISGKGIFIRSEHPLESGTECLFTLTLPRLPQPLSLKGVVRWAVQPPADPNASREEDPPGMGVEFVFDDEEERDAFRTVVDDLLYDELGETLFARLVASRGDHQRRGG
jgi:type IV pilus assembly protein PilZ